MAIPDLAIGPAEALAGAALAAPRPALSLEDLRRLREEWLGRAQREIDAARVIAQGPGCPDPATVIKYLQTTLNAAADAPCLALDDRALLGDAARVVARIACQRALETVLETGHA